jgi:DNA polymerase/3'-5' exonuclease PolX
VSVAWASGFQRRVFADALDLATLVKAQLEGACEPIEVAGSLRRCSAWIADIELVAVPRVEHEVMVRAPGELFATPCTIDHLEDAVARLKAQGFFGQHPKPAEGPRYKRLWLSDHRMQVDLFVVRPPAQFGPLFTVRTGPARFSTMMVTKLRGQQMRLIHGHVADFHDNPIDCKDERDFFRLCGVPYIAPEKRGDE